MSGPPPKPRELRQRARTHTRPELAALPSRSIVGHPKPPGGLLKATRQLWDSYWQSPVAAAALHIDLAGLERWILAVDEYNRTLKAIRKDRLVDGSAGQPRLNPLAGYLKQCGATIKQLEEAYGLTPMARLKLGISTAQARMSAADLNARMASDDDDSDEPDDPFLAEYEAAD